MAVDLGHTTVGRVPTWPRAASAAPPVRVPARAATQTAVRPEIQAIRALAVVLVVVYHLWPSVMPGGFIGVDVFFAISGLLITTHLLREVDRGGTVSLASFWARRARRILPAALLVLLLCGLATLALVPQARWSQFLGEISASATYHQNWQLASSSVDYLQSANLNSPVEHFWSLSAEEQFYLVWPLLIVLALRLSRSWSPRARRWAIGGVFGVLTAASLAYSIYETRTNPAAAYFITPTRAWEFGAGGLLALVRPPDGSRRALNSALSWAGLAAIAIAAITFSNGTPFPGVAALLPVLGALAVMQAGAPGGRWAPTAGLRLAPVQFLGDVSYSVYLYHWPLLIFAPFVLHGTSGEVGAGVVVLTLLAAALTKRLVEDPVRHSGWLRRARPRRTFAFAAIATGLVFAVPMAGGSALRGQLQHDRSVSAAVIAARPACFGAAARDPLHPCANPSLRLKVVPTPLQAQSEPNAPCTATTRTGYVNPCTFGVVGRPSTATVALLGDSHASHWRAALEVVAHAKGWRAVSITRTGCAFSTAAKSVTEPGRSQCRRWNAEVPRWFAAHPSVRTVFVSAITGGAVPTARGQSSFDAELSGFRRAWAQLPASVQHIVVIRDPPKARAATADCVTRARAAHVPAGTACALPRATALRNDPEVVAARLTAHQRAQSVDLTKLICDRRSCFPVVGGVLVYKDIHHLTTVFATTLGPFLLRDINHVMSTWR